MSNSDNNPDQKRVIANLTPSQKYRAAMDLLNSALSLKEASIKAWFPNLNEQERKQRLRDFLLYART